MATQEGDVHGRGPGAEDPAAAVARAAMVRWMDVAGVLDDPAWHAAFAEVPRHLFVPYFYDSTGGSERRLWCGDSDPGRRRQWLTGAYGDRALATRMRDGGLISSSSQPSLMACMLDALDVRDGQDVLEIGAGTGYNAALLAHRLGDAHVTTVDLDPEITESARAHLAAAGYRPTVVTGDGARGCPGRAPFDRVIATCALPSVPYAWVAQCRPGGRILAPLATGLIALAVEDGPGGHRAEGRFLHTGAYFVALRGAPAREGGRGAEEAGVPRRALANDAFRFLLALSAGALDPAEAYALWQRAHRPERERFGVTVRPDGQWAWLDDPGGPAVWPLTAA